MKKWIITILIGLILLLWIIYCYAEEENINYQQEYYKKQYDKEIFINIKKEDKIIIEFLVGLNYPCEVLGLSSYYFVPYFRILYEEQKETYKGDFIDFIFEKLNQRIANIDEMETILRKLIKYENQLQ